MSPSIGRMVIFTLPAEASSINGAREFPAVVTAVHSETLVNLRVFFDWDPKSVDTEWKTSVPHESAAHGYDGPTWRWPELKDSGR